MGKKIILTPILMIIVTSIFIILDNGGDVTQVNQIIQPIFFGITLILSVFFSNLRKYLIIIAITFLILLIFTYLFQMIEISAWLGNLGFGMLTITIFSYTPQFIRKGFIEKF